MKNIFLYAALMIIFPLLASGQTEGTLTTNCVLSAGANTTYLKDYVIKLSKAVSKTEVPVVKENMYLMKGTKYRFTLCNSEGSAGQLVITIYDRDRKIISSFDEKLGKTYNSVDFACNKTGAYTLWFSFKEGQQGMGVGVVSMVR
jgi:hypothetical protein